MRMYSIKAAGLLLNILLLKKKYNPGKKLFVQILKENEDVLVLRYPAELVGKCIKSFFHKSDIHTNEENKPLVL